MTLQFHSQVNPTPLTKGKQVFKQVYVHVCLQQHYSQEPKGGNNPNGHERINGSNCGMNMWYIPYIYDGILSHRKE